MVQILFRHGERLPLTKFVSTRHKGEYCYVNTSLFGNDDTLDNFVKTMTEYSGKQPPGNYFKNWELFPNIGDAPKGTLTGIGATQHVRLGQFIRDKYLTSSTIFSREIPLDSQMYISSSNTPRTYQSAIAFLFGLLGRSKFNLTNYNIGRSDKLFCLTELPSQKKCGCHYGMSLNQQISRIRRTYFNKNSSLKGLYTGITSLVDLVEIISLTYCHNGTEVCLPKPHKLCFNSSDFDRIWDDFYSENRFVYENSSDMKYYYASYYPFMTKIADRIHNSINNNDPTNLVIYSGHDNTLIGLLQLFGYDGTWIRFAGRIVIELFKSTDNDVTPGKVNGAKGKSSGMPKHYVRIVYDGKDLTEYVTFCKGKTFKGLCDVSLLYDFVYKHMEQELKKSNLGDICSEDISGKGKRGRG